MNDPSGLQKLNAHQFEPRRSDTHVSVPNFGLDELNELHEIGNRVHAE